MSAEDKERLKEIFIGHGFPGAAKLYAVAKSKGLKLTQAQVTEFVKSQEVAQLHAEPKKKAGDIPITADGKGTDTQLDLLDMSQYYSKNKGYRWILMLVDVFTRQAACAPIQSKSPDKVLPALQDAIKQLKVKPVQIVSDQGTEFMGSVGTWLDEQNISHRTVEVGSHNTLGIINNFSKFLKNSLHKHFTHSQNTNWVDYLPTLIQNYADTPHAGLKPEGDQAFTPNEAGQFETDIRNLTAAKIAKAEEKKKPSKLVVGSWVRVKKSKATFDRGYHVKYSVKVFRITEIEKGWFVLDNGKKYREDNLQAVKPPNLVEERKEEGVLEQPPLPEKRPALAPGRARSPTPERKAPEKSAEGRSDIARQARFEKKNEDILKHREGLDVGNRREGLRTRNLSSQLFHPRYGSVKW